MNYWIVAAIIFAYLLIGLVVDSGIFGADSPINRKNLVVWLLWPVVVISAIVGLIIKCASRRKKDGKR